MNFNLPIFIHKIDIDAEFIKALPSSLEKLISKA